MRIFSREREDEKNPIKHLSGSINLKLIFSADMELTKKAKINKFQ